MNDREMADLLELANRTIRVGRYRATGYAMTVGGLCATLPLPLWRSAGLGLAIIFTVNAASDRLAARWMDKHAPRRTT